MPRYISKARAFKKAVVKAHMQLVNTQYGPEMREVTQPIIALFRQGGATPRELELAKERFRFRGVAEGEDPLWRISIYDTDEEARAHNWSPELKAQIEQALDAGQSPDYFKVEKDPAKKPWPLYDETAPEDIEGLALSTGVPIVDVMAYEEENQNRPKVLKVLRELLDKEVVVQA